MLDDHRHSRHRRRDVQQSALRAALVALAALVAVTYVVFNPRWPFGSEYEIRGVFSSANQLRPGKPVRIAGVEVGEVTGIDPGPGDTAVVTMRIRDEGRPVHQDATLKIEPRLILEGNFYVDLRPGTPTAPELRTGATIPRERTAVPVQLDQVLTAFDSPTRTSLNAFNRELARALGPEDKSRSGAAGLRRAMREFDATLRDITVVSGAFQGTRDGDLTRMVRYLGDFTGQLGEDPDALADLVTNTNRVTGALAENDVALGNAVRELDATLAAAPAAFTALDRELPRVSRFARTLEPALRQAPVPLGATAELLDETARLVSPPELPAFTDLTEPIVRRMPAFERRLGELFRFVTPVNECVITHYIPVLNQTIDDGPNTTGQPIWLDALHSFVSGSNASPNFDANGKNIRVTISGGDNLLQGFVPGLGDVATGLAPDKIGTSPVWLGPGVRPPHRPDAPCVDQPLPNLRLRRALGLPRGFTSEPAPPQRSQMSADFLRRTLDDLQRGRRSR